MMAFAFYSNFRTVGDGDITMNPSSCEGNEQLIQRLKPENISDVDRHAIMAMIVPYAV